MEHILIKRLNFDDTCGQLEFSQNNPNLIKINKFELHGNYYHELTKENLFNQPLTDPYSCEYGEKQISQFILFTIPTTVFYLEPFPEDPSQYAQRVTWDSGNNFNQMHIRLVINPDENHELYHEIYVEYPYGRESDSITVTAAQKFVIQKP